MESSKAQLAAERHKMVSRQLRARGIRDARVLAAFEDVPRERFVPLERRHEAYGDHPVPIGHGQTISQPFVVALMVEELQVCGEHRVLDVGAGSGYQTAILARLVRWVCAIERIGELARRAEAALRALEIDNVTMRTGDGSLGWPEEAPFDRIICGAAAPDVPEGWIAQLADGGRIVVPVGGQDHQSVVCVERHGKKTTRRSISDVRFVKLIGEQGWADK